MNRAKSSLTFLDEFLLESYQTTEFVRLVERTFGAGVAADLPGNVESPRLFMFQAVRVLLRRGLLDSRFFGAIARERPHRLEEIRKIASGMTTQPPEETETVVYRRPEASPADSRRTWVEALEQHILARERQSDDPDGRLARAIDGLARRLRSQQAPSAGSIVAGTRLERILGTGQFGTVWLAQHLRSGARVATKIFNSDRLTESLMLWRFRRSIRALQTLQQHRDVPPSIPPVIEVADDTLAFAMPFFSEGTIENIDRRGWSLNTKIDVFLEICRATAFAHRIGVIHRDIKPANVLLDQTLRPALVDYDISEIRFVTELPDAGGGLGTPVFAAPEQLENASEADERSDIYSLGRLFYYILLERSPGYQIEREPTLNNLGDFPPALVAIIRRATLWEPRLRFASVHEMIVAVERHRTGLAAARARLANAGRWVRQHAMVLTTCMTLTSASAHWAIIEQEQAAKLKAVVADAKSLSARLVSEMSKSRASIREAHQTLADLEMRARELSSDEGAGPHVQELAEHVVRLRHQFWHHEQLEDEALKTQEALRSLIGSKPPSPSTSSPPPLLPPPLSAPPTTASPASSRLGPPPPPKAVGTAIERSQDLRPRRGSNRAKRRKPPAPSTSAPAATFEQLDADLKSCRRAHAYEDLSSRRRLLIEVHDGAASIINSDELHKMQLNTQNCIEKLLQGFRFARSEEGAKYALDV